MQKNGSKRSLLQCPAGFPSSRRGRGSPQHTWMNDVQKTMQVKVIIAQNWKDVYVEETLEYK